MIYNILIPSPLLQDLFFLIPLYIIFVLSFLPSFNPYINKLASKEYPNFSFEKYLSYFL